MSDIDIEIRRSSRKTLSIEITKDARVIVRAPYRMPVMEIKRFVNQKSDWIESHLAAILQKQDENRKFPVLTEDEIKELMDKACKVIPEKVSHFAPLVGVTYGRITIRKQKTRWGSCSSKGNLNFNCLLMLTPSEIQDYVVVHELCHRKEMNHSDRFWCEVEKILPDYRIRRTWLKENGSSIIQ